MFALAGNNRIRDGKDASELGVRQTQTVRHNDLAAQTEGPAEIEKGAARKVLGFAQIEKELGDRRLRERGLHQRHEERRRPRRGQTAGQPEEEPGVGIPRVPYGHKARG